MRKGAWPTVVTVVALAVVAGLTATALSRSGDDATAADAGSGYAANRAAAEAEAQRILDAVSLPPGAVREGRSPITALDQAVEGMGPSDTTLTRTAWWTVPERPTATAQWLRRHVPEGLRWSGGGASRTAGDGTPVRATSFDGAGSMTYTAPGLAVGWAGIPGGTAVRFDVYLSARAARTPEMTLPGTITDATITRTTTSTTGAHQPTTTTRTFSAAAETSRLVEAINALPGVSISDTVGTGVGMLDQRSYRLRIDWPGHNMLAAFDNGILNGATAVLTLDGRRLHPDLEPSGRLLKVVDDLLARSSEE